MKAFRKAIIAMTGIAVIFMGAYTASAESLTELEAKWGAPKSVKALANGVERRIYGEKDVEVGYFYFLVKDGQVVDRGVTQNLDKADVKEAKNPKMSGFMSSYYKNNKTTIADIKAKYGEPVNSSSYDNGMERLVFGPEDSNAGYNVFVVMNGVVVDQGTTRVLFVEEKEADGPVVSPFMSNWYKNHPKSLSFVKDKWGQPISVKEYKNGMKKMVFGPYDSETGYNFFIIKDGQVVDRGFTKSKS